MSLVDEKKAARQAAFLRRREAHAALQSAASSNLRAHLTGLRGATLAGYLPIRTEADPLPAMTALLEHNRICVPIVMGSGLPLVFREWTPDGPQEEGAFGVMVPTGGKELVPDVLIVPLVAFDFRGYRLGYGGGFYDRTLEQLRLTGPVRAIGFAYSAQQTDHLPLEPTDQPLDEVVTEKGAFTIHS